MKSTLATNATLWWQHAGYLPAQKGFSRNIGTAGLLGGVLDDKYILVGAGANFPYESALNKGQKVLHSDLYLLENIHDSLKVKEHYNLDQPVAYGSSISSDKGIYHIGSAEGEHASDVLLINIKDGLLNTQKIAKLPFSFDSGAAVLHEDVIYIIAGNQNKIASNKLYALNLASSEIKELAPLPAAARTQLVAQVLDGNIYAFSGGDAQAFTDGWRYDIAANKWMQVADVELNAEKISLLGANSIKLNEYEMLVLGGFNKQVYDDAIKSFSTLKSDELAQFRQKYFTTDASEFAWNKQILVYNSLENKWRSLGLLPFDAPCAAALVQLGCAIYSINGEIKPGLRTSAMYKGCLLELDNH